MNHIKEIMAFFTGNKVHGDSLLEYKIMYNFINARPKMSYKSARPGARAPLAPA